MSKLFLLPLILLTNLCKGQIGYSTEYKYLEKKEKIYNQNIKNKYQKTDFTDNIVFGLHHIKGIKDKFNDFSPNIGYIIKSDSVHFIQINYRFNDNSVIFISSAHDNNIILTTTMFAGDKLNIIDYYNNNFFIIKNKNLKINPALN